MEESRKDWKRYTSAKLKDFDLKVAEKVVKVGLGVGQETASKNFLGKPERKATIAINDFRTEVFHPLVRPRGLFRGLPS